jgi:microcystin-dependent protein
MTYSDAFNIRTKNVKFNDVADAIDGTLTRGYGGTTTGTSTAYIASPSPAWTAYDTSIAITIIPHVTNTGAATLNVSGLGAKALKKNGVDIGAGFLLAGSPVLLIYTGTYFEVIIAETVSPIGTIVSYAFSTAPTGWLLCAGQPVSRTTYANLHTLMANDGYPYGNGDGSTTFNVPDLRGRVIAGLDNMGGTDAGRLSWANTLGTTGGAQTHTLTTAEMPSHTHIQDSHNHTQNSHNHTQNSHNHTQDAHSHTTTQSYAYLRGGAQGEAGGGQGFAWHLDTQGVNATTATNQATTATNQATTATNNATTATNQNAGGGGAHNNMQPTILMNYIIKY